MYQSNFVCYEIKKKKKMKIKFLIHTSYIRKLFKHPQKFCILSFQMEHRTQEFILLLSTITLESYIYHYQMIDNHHLVSHDRFVSCI